MPAASVLALWLHVATPLLSVTGWPSCVVPMKKVTVPVGVPLPEAGATVAVAVTKVLEPAVMVVGEMVSAVLVAARFVTVKLTGEEVEPL